MADPNLSALAAQWQSDLSRNYDRALKNDVLPKVTFRVTPDGPYQSRNMTMDEFGQWIQTTNERGQNMVDQYNTNLSNKLSPSNRENMILTYTPKDNISPSAIVDALIDQKNAYKAQSTNINGIGDLRRSDASDFLPQSYIIPGKKEPTPINLDNVTPELKQRVEDARAIQANKTEAMNLRKAEATAVRQAEQVAIDNASEGNLNNGTFSFRDLGYALGGGNGLKYCGQAISQFYKDNPGTTITAGILSAILVSYGLYSLAKKWNAYRKKNKDLDNDSVLDFD